MQQIIANARNRTPSLLAVSLVPSPLQPASPNEHCLIHNAATVLAQLCCKVWCLSLLAFSTAAETSIQVRALMVIAYFHFVANRAVGRKKSEMASNIQRYSQLDYKMFQLVAFDTKVLGSVSDFRSLVFAAVSAY